MKGKGLKTMATVLSLGMALSLAACGNPSGGGKEDEDNKTLVVQEGYTKISLGDMAGVNAVGTSVEFDPHFFSQNVNRGLVNDVEKEWQIVKDRVVKMGIDRFRVMIMPSWLEPFNDNDDVNSVNWDALTPNSVEMQSLYMVLDLAQENNIDVNLTLWGAEKNVSLLDVETNAAIKAQGGHFLIKGNENSNNWVVGTYHPEEFAENFSIYIQLLRGKKGYTCIKEITPVNEPDWSYQINNAPSFEHYKQMCLALDARFKKDGIRDEVKFNLSDNCDTRREWLVNTVDALDDVADMYNSHTYIFGYETDNATIYAWEEENRNVTRNTGKPHVIGEFGSNQTTGSTRQADIDTYARGVLLVREMLNFYNAGAAGASYWVLFDEYYNPKDNYQDGLMMLGLWKSSRAAYNDDPDYRKAMKEDYEVRPQYYAFSLFSKYVPKGAQVYPIECGNSKIAGSAFRGTDGKWVYVIANGSENTVKFALHNAGAYGTFEKYEYKEGALPQGDNLIAASATEKVKNQVLEFESAAQTVTLYREV